MTEDRGQRTEAGGRMTEGRGQKPALSEVEGTEGRSLPLQLYSGRPLSGAEGTGLSWGSKSLAGLFLTYGRDI